jgi:hypothetical protein
MGLVSRERIKTMKSIGKETYSDMSVQVVVLSILLEVFENIGVMDK